MDQFRSLAIWVLQFLLAALFAIQGIMKLTRSPAWISRFNAWGYPDHFYDGGCGGRLPTPRGPPS